MEQDFAMSAPFPFDLAITVLGVYPQNNYETCEMTCAQGYHCNTIRKSKGWKHSNVRHWESGVCVRGEVRGSCGKE